MSHVYRIVRGVEVLEVVEITQKVLGMYLADSDRGSAPSLLPFSDVTAMLHTLARSRILGWASDVEFRMCNDAVGAVETALALDPRSVVGFNFRGVRCVHDQAVWCDLHLLESA